jgi:hypothetical protein
MSFSAFALASLLILTVACSTQTRELGWERKDFNGKLNSIKPAVANEVRRDALVLWSKRHERSSLEGALKEFEKLANSKARNYQILVYLSRGYYLLADAFETNPKNKIILWEKGLRFGEQALAQDDSFRARVESNVPVERSATMLSSEYIGALYWTAANLARWSKESGIAVFLKHKSQIKTFLQIVDETDPNYFYSATSRFLGAYYAYTPSIAGGDLKLSSQYFNQALDAYPQYLGTKVLLAELYYTKLNKKNLFTKYLEEVIQTDTSKYLEIEPENILAKRKAEHLLSITNELFP